MNRHPPVRFLLAVLATAILAALALGMSLRVGVPAMRLTSWVVAAELVTALTIARLVPVPLTRRTLHTVNTTAFLLATLLLPLPAVMLGMVAICVATDIMRRRSGGPGGRVGWYDTTFNSAERVLRVGAAALVFRLVSGTPTLAGPVSDRAMVAVMLAALTMYVTNIGLVQVMLSILVGRWQLAALLRLLRVNLPQEGSQLLLGVLGAIIAGPAPVLVGIPLLRTVIVSRELSQQRGDAPMELFRDDETAVRAAAAFGPPSSFIAWI
jgi:hypothetical protein